MGNTGPGRKPFAVGQDRSIDPLTVSFFCTGCPFKGIKTRTRTNANANGSTNPIQWTSSGHGMQAPMMHVQYECNSPNFNYAQTLLQETSTIGMGWCPFLSKRDLLMGDDGDQ